MRYFITVTTVNGDLVDVATVTSEKKAKEIATKVFEEGIEAQCGPEFLDIVTISRNTRDTVWTERYANEDFWRCYVL